MRIDTPRARLDLAADEIARLRQACRTRIDCLDGTAWITLDGDARDIVLARGESFLVDSGDDVLVSALRGGAVVDVLPPARAVRCAPHAVPRAARPAAPWSPAWSRARAAWLAWAGRARGALAAGAAR